MTKYTRYNASVKGRARSARWRASHREQKQAADRRHRLLCDHCIEAEIDRNSRRRKVAGSI